MSFKMKSPWQWLINKFESPEQVKQSTYAFMPAALEVQETPPNPVGRAIIWTIVVLFVVVVVWGIVGKMDVVAVAQGKIIPSGRVKTIQPLEIGKAGEALITLDSTATQADTDRLYNQLQMTELQQARQLTLQSLLEQPEFPSDWLHTFKNGFIEKQSIISPALYSTEQRLLIEQVNQYQSQRKTLENQKNQRHAEQRRIQANITKHQRTLPLITERTDGLKHLVKKEMVARAQYLELEQERIEQQQDLAAFKAEYEEMQAMLQSLDGQLETLKAETQTNNLNTLAQTNQTISQLQQELIKAQQRNQQQVITSPITGSVQQLAIHTVGGVVWFYPYLADT
jgi:membrane fusion protein, hemolysin D